MRLKPWFEIFCHSVKPKSGNSMCRVQCNDTVSLVQLPKWLKVYIEFLGNSVKLHMPNWQIYLPLALGNTYTWYVWTDDLTFVWFLELVRNEDSNLYALRKSYMHKRLHQKRRKGLKWWWLGFHRVCPMKYAHWLLCLFYGYYQVSNIRRTKSQHLKEVHTVLRLPLPNPLMPDVKSRMKM